MLIEFYAKYFTKSYNFINIEYDCQITIDNNIVNIKSGK